ncbi:MAG: alginate export family protein, partial [Candidatus Riflebacteria bacterium]|nr:alginate export family protein [Candidatus Riflebacteria bacterium]
MMRGAILVSVLVLFLGGLAQGTPPAKAPAEDEPKFSGSLRVRVESLSNINDLSDAKDDDNDYAVSRLRLKADMPMGNGRRAQLVLQDARAFGEEFAVPGGERRMDLQEGYLEEKHFLGADGLMLRFGRQELAYGEERLVGTFGYNNVGRTYDAVKLRWDREGAWHEAFVSRIVHDPLAPSQQSLWGSHNSFDLGGARVLEAYVLRKLDPRAAVRQDRFTYGLRSKGP